MKNQKITSDTKSPLGDRCPTNLQATDTSQKLLSIFIVEHDVVYYGISLSQGGLSQLCPSQTLAHPSLLSVETEGETEKVLMLCKPCSELVKTSVTNLKHSTIWASVKKISSNKYIMIQLSICLFSWKSNRLTEHTKAICATSFWSCLFFQRS